MNEWDHCKALIDSYKEDDDYLKKLNIAVGEDLSESIVESLSEYGNKVLFCTGNRSMRNLGFLDHYLTLFKKKGLTALHFDNISTNPTLKQMELGIELATDFEPDVIFALGGGSVIDTAKVLSVGSYGDVWDFVEKKQTIAKALPLVACSTTSGTGSHVTPYAVLTNTDTLQKKTLKHELLLPKKGIVDVSITKHAPTYIASTTGFDVICHAAEVYTRTDCTESAKAFSKRSLELVKEHLVPSCTEGGHQHKIGMAYADLYAGIALALIGTHVPHAISHPISARFPVVNHGQALAYITSETFRFLQERSDDQTAFEDVSTFLGGEKTLSTTLNEYAHKLGLLTSLKKFTLKEIDLIVKDTLGYRKSSIERSPVPLTEEEVRELITKALFSK